MAENIEWHMNNRFCMLYMLVFVHNFIDLWEQTWNCRMFSVVCPVHCVKHSVIHERAVSSRVAVDSLRRKHKATVLQANLCNNKSAGCKWDWSVSPQRLGPSGPRAGGLGLVRRQSTANIGLFLYQRYIVIPFWESSWRKTMKRFWIFMNKAKCSKFPS